MTKKRSTHNSNSQISELQNSILIKLLRDIDIDDIINQYITPNDKQILDIFCRTGNITIKIAKTFPFSQVLGIEENQKYLKIAKMKRRRSMLPNLEFVSLANMPTLKEHNDLVTMFFALTGHSKEKIKDILINIKPTLKLRGKILIVDVEPDKITHAGLIIGLYLSLFYKKRPNYSINILLEETGYNIIKQQVVRGVTIILANLPN